MLIRMERTELRVNVRNMWFRKTPVAINDPLNDLAAETISRLTSSLRLSAR